MEDKFTLEILIGTHSVRLEHVFLDPPVLDVIRDTGENIIAITNTGAVAATYNPNLDVAILGYQGPTAITLFYTKKKSVV